MRSARSERSPTFCILPCSTKRAFVWHFGPLLKALRSAAGLRLRQICRRASSVSARRWKRRYSGLCRNASQTFTGTPGAKTLRSGSHGRMAASCSKLRMSAGGYLREITDRRKQSGWAFAGCRNVSACSTASWNFSMRGRERWSALSCPAHPRRQANQVRTLWPPERLGSVPIRIFVADDHDIVREGVKSLLKSRPEWMVCGEASDGIQAASLIGKADCDIAILDISMPGKSGLEVAASVSHQHPKVKILIFTMHSGKTLHSAAREAGAHGVVQKSFA